MNVKEILNLEYFLMVLRSGFELEKGRKAKETLKPEAEWEVASSVLSIHLRSLQSKMN